MLRDTGIKNYKTANIMKYFAMMYNQYGDFEESDSRLDRGFSIFEKNFVSSETDKYP